MQSGDYDDLRSAVESAGFASDIHPDSSGGVHAVVATHRGDGFLFGNSFRVGFRDGRWYLFTWTPNFYRLPQNADPAEVSLACLQSGTKTVSQFPSSLVERYGLEWVSPEAYDRACDHDSER
jgi:hypothetical protein